MNYHQVLARLRKAWQEHDLETLKKLPKVELDFSFHGRERAWLNSLDQPKVRYNNARSHL